MPDGVKARGNSVCKITNCDVGKIHTFYRGKKNVPFSKLPKQSEISDIGEQNKYGPHVLFSKQRAAPGCGGQFHQGSELGGRGAQLRRCGEPLGGLNSMRYTMLLWWAAVYTYTFYASTDRRLSSTREIINKMKRKETT